MSVALRAPVAGRLTNRFNATQISSIGVLIFCVGLGSLALLPEHPKVADFLWRVALCGMGYGCFLPPNNKEMSLTPQKTGLPVPPAFYQPQELRASLSALPWSPWLLHSSEKGAEVSRGNFRCTHLLWPVPYLRSHYSPAWRASTDSVTKKRLHKTAGLA